MQKLNQRRTRPQHSCCSTLPLLQAWCVWNLHDQRMRHHHKLRITALQHCSKHGGRKAKPCSVVGCTTPSRCKGLCARHGGGFIIYSEYIAMSNATLVTAQTSSSHAEDVRCARRIRSVQAPFGMHVPCSQGWQELQEACR